MILLIVLPYCAGYLWYHSKGSYPRERHDEIPTKTTNSEVVLTKVVVEIAINNTYRVVFVHLKYLSLVGNITTVLY